MSEKSISVFSEIGKLKKVLVHRPGEELNNLAPEYLERLLFDDTPFLEIAQQEHDVFTNTLTKLGIKVIYITDLITEALTTTKLKEEFIAQFVAESGIINLHQTDAMMNYFLKMDTKAMIDKMIAGVFVKEVTNLKKESLASMLDNGYPFLCEPLPNLLFQRDPFSSIGNGVTLHHMYAPTRRRETIFAEYIFKHHSDYIKTPLYYGRDLDSSIEGGDILVLKQDTLLIGISQRTNATAIDSLAQNILAQNTVFKTIIALKIPSSRAFMHLDTVFTQVDYNTFIIHTAIEEALHIYRLTRNDTPDYGVKVIQEKHTLKDILTDCLGSKVTLIRCAAGDVFYATKEQWNNGINTLAISPGEVVVYDRNLITNKALQAYGIKTHIVPSSELSRGKGGPRCMSMPLIRETL